MLAVLIKYNTVPITQDPDNETTDSMPTEQPMTDDFENCEQLHPSLSLSWTVDRSSENVTFMLCGCTTTDVDQ